MDDRPHATSAEKHFFRFHLPHQHLETVFGGDWFALKAEAFARFFGTPFFLISQTVVVGVWIIANATGFTSFDLYPFILLNLAFSLQAAYAAPLILLAQTRQADRDKAHALADAAHREEIHQMSPIARSDEPAGRDDAAEHRSDRTDQGADRAGRRTDFGGSQKRGRRPRGLAHAMRRNWCRSGAVGGPAICP
jgi:Protein of unknown function (DUF1003)